MERNYRFQLNPDTAVAYAGFFEGIMTAAPDEFDYLARGQFARQQGNWAAALANFDLALDRNSSFAEAWYYRGMANRDAGNFSQALADYTAAVNADPAYPAAFYARGGVYRRLEDYDEAIRDYDRAIDLEPDDADFYYARGLAYALLKRHTLAIEDFKESLILEPENPDACYELGRAYWETQQWKEALKSFDAALDIEPNHPNTRYTLGNIELDDGMPTLAQLEYDKALIAAPESADIWYRRGIAMNGQCADVIEIGLQKHLPRLSAEALDCFNRALRFGREASAQLYLNRGTAHNYAKEYPEALADLNLALEMEDGLATAYRIRATVHWEMGNPMAAEADLQQYRRITGRDVSQDCDYDPDFPFGPEPREE